MNRRTFIKASLTATAAVAGSVLLDGPLSSASAVTVPNTTEDAKMKILVLTGSPRKNGNSNTLAEHFINGAKEAGHEVTRFDAASSKVHPCIACNKCGMNGPCVFKDDFEVVREHIIPADLVAFATPMYYLTTPSQRLSLSPTLLQPTILYLTNYFYTPTPQTRTPSLPTNTDTPQPP